MYIISSARVQRARRYLTPSKSSSVSPDFDATTHPIIARYWFGIRSPVYISQGRRPLRQTGPGERAAARACRKRGFRVVEGAGRRGAA